MILQKNRRRQNGVGKITLIVFSAIIASIVYLGFQILPFYYYYFELENQFAAHIRVASTHTDQEIRKKIEYHLKKLAIPADPEALKIERSREFMRISLKYTEIFEIYWQGKYHTIWKFPFNAKAEGKF
ncbi:MAG: hypothetical protein R3A13_03615 [Bdellovibrionota bacterium]